MPSELCPFCRGKFRGLLEEHQVQALNPPHTCLSRRDNKTVICRLCGCAEALADRMGGPLSDEMARVVVLNEWEERRRLPGGGWNMGAGIMPLPEEMLV